MRRWDKVMLCVCVGLFAAGCPKGGEQFNAGQKAENIQDYDSALQFYQKALATDPNNAAYRIKLNQVRFEAGESHIKKGVALREKGDMQAAAAEFQRATTLDPSSPVALQELRQTLDQINETARKQDERAVGGNFLFGKHGPVAGFDGNHQRTAAGAEPDEGSTVEFAERDHCARHRGQAGHRPKTAEGYR